MKTILSFHRFLLNQHLYPIVLSSILAVSLFAGRVFISNNWFQYRPLVWNLFLAWIPYGFSFLAASLQRVFPRQWWLLLFPGALWLIFFPNSPYILTDFVHLTVRPPVPFLYDILLLSTFAWTGLFLAVASLRTMQLLVKTYAGWLVSWLFAIAVLALSGLGIYLGRFLRWHSWDLLFRPEHILEDIAARLVDPLSHLPFYAFTMAFTAFLLVCYLMFISVHSVRESGEG